MDATDLALRDLRVVDSMVGRSLVEPPWGIAVDSDDTCILAAVTQGEMWATRAGSPPVHLGPGDVVVSCGGATLRLGDHPDSDVDVVIAGRDACYDPSTGADLSERCLIGGRTFGSRDGSVSVLVAAFATTGATYDLLAADLPAMLIVPSHADVSAILDIVAVETESNRPGQQVAVDRLMELLALASIRTWLRAAPAEIPSWAASLDDPVAGPALRAMHTEPARSWTVAELAALAAVSRSAFARRFRARVGVAPLAHLVRWRMALATDLMRAEPHLGLAEVAAAVGYSDAFSFSNAYRRVRGVSPSQARRTPARSA